ncbi:hypothetical protein KI387_033536, partial [Taxus chinensis]
IDVDNSMIYVVFEEYEIDQCKYPEQIDFPWTLMFDAALRDVEKLDISTKDKTKK